DQQILKLLQKNAKLGTKEIAATIGLSVTPTFERIKRLERKKIILGYSTKLNRNQIGKGLQVFCQTSLKSHHLDLIEQFEESIVRLEEVVACHHIAGNIDYLLYIEVKDMEEYQQFLRNKLAVIPNIANVQTSFVMRTLKEN
ncbi:MAG: Lrp/AsnC family transcriptional regulator, partial [Flavobacteriia bacterium]|nr:Lrp/AsnC family transcriptional regulator [Flavobacteriia bacterium]